MIKSRYPINDTRFEAMQESPLEFYSTGSRYFKYAVPEGTDYDFFVQDHEGLVLELERLGFKRLPKQACYGEDTECESVWEAAGIHVQVVHDAKKKRCLQTLLCGYSHLLENKAQAKCIWDLLYAAYESGRKSVY